ncbi:urease subunit alpha, partial [Staphylococcus aureus]|nr:urease subunit alpha [Staphylococcus aureus]
IFLWDPIFFGVKPELVEKGGLINSAVKGDANGSIPTSEPKKYRKMYGQYGGNHTSTSMTIVSKTAYENGINRALNI